MGYSLTLEDIESIKPEVSKGGYTLSLEDIESVPSSQPSPPKHNLLEMTGNRAIPEEQRQQLPEFAAGAAQGVANIIPETYNIGADKPMKPFNFAPDTEVAKQGEIAGDIGSFFIPGLGTDAALAKAAHYIPHINKLLGAIKANKPLNSLLKMEKTGAEVGYYAARKAPEGEAGNEALKGYGEGNLLEGATQLISSKYPILSRLGLAGAGYMGGSMVGHPWTGVGVAALVPQLRGAIKGFSREELAQNALDGLSPEKVKKAVDANNRLGTIPTPGQAAGSYVTTGKEGRIRREAGHLGEELETQQIDSQKKVVNKLLDDIYVPSKKNNDEINALYKQSYEHDLSPTEILTMQQNPEIAAAFKELESKPSLQHIPINNYEYLNEVKKHLEAKGNSLMLDPKTKHQGMIVNDVATAFNNYLKQKNTIYKNALKKAQPKIVRENLERRMNVLDENISAKNLYTSLLGSRKKAAETIKELKAFPKAQKALVDIRHGWKEYANKKPTSQAESQGKSFIDNARNVLDYVNSFLKSTAGKVGTEQKARYMHSKDWQNDFHLLEKSKDKGQSLKKTLDMVGKLGLSYGLSDKEVGNLKDLIVKE